MTKGRRWLLNAQSAESRRRRAMGIHISLSRPAASGREAWKGGRRAGTGGAFQSPTWPDIRQPAGVWGSHTGTTSARLRIGNPKASHSVLSPN